MSELAVFKCYPGARDANHIDSCWIICSGRAQGSQESGDGREDQPSGALETGHPHEEPDAKVFMGAELYPSGLLVSSWAGERW